MCSMARAHRRIALFAVGQCDTWQAMHVGVSLAVVEKVAASSRERGPAAEFGETPRSGEHGFGTIARKGSGVAGRRQERVGHSATRKHTERPSAYAYQSENQPGTPNQVVLFINCPRAIRRVRWSALASARKKVAIEQELIR